MAEQEEPKELNKKNGKRRLAIEIDIVRVPVPENERIVWETNLCRLFDILEAMSLEKGEAA